MSRFFLYRALALLCLLLLALPAMAVETNAVIKGEVVDPDGLPVPHSEVALTSPQLLGSKLTIADIDGRFRFTALPPGSYTLAVTPIGPGLEDAMNRTHPTMEPWVSQSFRVALGATIDLEIVLALKGSTSITVVGSNPVVDTEAVQTGATFDAEFLKDIPLGRDYQSVTAITPGVVGSGNANMHGGFDSSNQFYVDGVNITDPMTNTFSMNMNYDAIESLQIITGGMDAEYGRSLGGAVNIVTKSGGNEVEGFAVMTYQAPSMVLGKKLPGDSDNTDLAQQLVANIGGPIVKDKVWFFASLQGDRYVRTTAIDPAETGRDLNRFPMPQRDWRSLYIFGKVTAQPHDAHRVWAHIQADPTWIDNVDQSVYTLPSAEQVQNQGGWLASLGHHWTPSNKVFVETQAYYQKSTIEYFPILWKDCQNRDDYSGACTDDFVGTTYGGETVTEGWLGLGSTDYSSGEFPYASFNRRYRTSLNSSATFWFDFLGEHEAKTGIQAEYMSSYNIVPGFEEGIPFHTYNPDLDPEGIGSLNLDAYEPALLYQFDNNQETRLGAMMGSFYVQDVYKPFSRLALRPGIRVDYSNLRDDLKNPVFNKLTVAPRFGAVFDLTNDGKTMARAFYGRFYDAGFLAISDLLKSKSSGYAGYPWDAREGDWDFENPQFEVNSTFLRFDELKNPYSDEFNVGLTREVGSDAALDVTFVHEMARAFWEDDEVNLIWDDEGSNVIGYRNGENIAIYRLRTPNDTYTRYTSMEFTVRKDFSNHWGMIASYTWARADGTNSSDQATFGWDIPEQRQYERGLLDHDITHQLKTTGSYTQDGVWKVGKLRAGYVVGWNFALRSGALYRPIVWNNYYGSFANLDSVSEGRYRLPAFSRTDLRGAFRFAYGNKAAWLLGVDVFNVFNDRTITNVNTTYDPELTGDEQTFGDVLNRQGRRNMQIVLRGEF